MRFRLILAAVAIAGLAACETPTGPMAGLGPEPAVITFDTADFAWSTAPGTGAIEGQLTYRGNGVPFTCEAAGVVLTPETPWVRRRMQILYNSADSAVLPADEVRARTPAERSQDYSGYVRRAPCDAEGRFNLTGLPAGAWYLITVARPQGAAGPEMALMQRVVVRNGRTARVRL